MITEYMKNWLKNYSEQPTEGLVEIGVLRPEILELLLTDLNALTQSFTKYDIFTRSDGSSVSGVGLYSPDGDYTRWNEHYDPSGKRYYISNTNIRQIKSVRNYPSCNTTSANTQNFYEVYSCFPGYRRVTLQQLDANFGIGMHSDSVDEERKRVHIALTNPEAVYYIDNKFYKMQIGGIYWFNGFLLHSATNNTPDPRVNLIADCFTESNYNVFIQQSRQNLKLKNLIV